MRTHILHFKDGRLERDDDLGVIDQSFLRDVFGLSPDEPICDTLRSMDQRQTRMVYALAGKYKMSLGSDLVCLELRTDGEEP